MERNLGSSDRKTLPIERGFPVERVNELAAKESRAKHHYRPIYTMHKWWARRHGCVFRAICLYALLDDPEAVEVRGPDGADLDLERVDPADPERLWDLYPTDVRIGDKKILDPFAGGGTSLVEASRLGVEADGYDLNPVAWFVTKKELEAGRTDPGELEAAFRRVEAAVADEIRAYYRTPCPNGDHDADVMYAFWVKELDCVSCGRTVSLFPDYRVADGRYGNDDRYNAYCPDCESIVLVDDWRAASTCGECGREFVPEDGPVSRDGTYACPACGRRHGITDAVRERGGYDRRLYAVEYYCPTCDLRDRPRSEVKGYKAAGPADRDLFERARREWREREDLREYVPDESIPEGAITAASSISGNDVFRHGLEEWTDMFNERQLLCLATLLAAIDRIEPRNAREYLLLGLSESLNYNTMLASYNPGKNLVANVFNTNSFDPPQRPVENNVWGTRFGTGSFASMWEMIVRGVEYAGAPTERHVEDGETVETPPFDRAIGEGASVRLGDMRRIDAEDEYDAVVTDPPYYDNVIYSEVADYFYVWQKLLLSGEYEGFDRERTPRTDSIVANPSLGRGTAEFASELREAFATVRRALAADGVLAFTYHHSDAESWGAVLGALCDAGFEVTATYPIAADLNKFIGGETVSFDVVVVARPADEREPISWPALRRNVVRTATRTRRRLEEHRDLSTGDVGVVEMGRAFHEYSKHHGEVRRDGEIMSAREVVEEVHGIVRRGSGVDEIDAFLDLLALDDPTRDDLDALIRGADATADAMREAALYRTDGGEFVLGTWDDGERMACVRERVHGDDGLTPLDRAQFLRHRYERGESTGEFRERWDGDDLRELCEALADASGDDAYRRLLEGT